VTVTESDAIEVLGAVSKGTRKGLTTIVVDAQEKMPLSRFFDPKLIRVDTATLSTGDYSVKGGTAILAIERKSLPDLLHCVTHDRERFMDQMRRLKNYPSRFLIIEATRATIEAEAYQPNVRASSIVGTLLGLAVRWNICVVYCKDQKEAAERVQWICLKVAELQKEGFYDDRDESTAAGT
jgi:DNA excision repair protein ERCC-4